MSNQQLDEAPNSSHDREEAGPARPLRQRLSRWERIQNKWYNVRDDFLFPFAERFQSVPEFSGGPLWASPMPKQEVVNRLFGRIPNEGEDQIPAEVITYFTDLVQFASSEFADLQQRLANNEYHLERLLGFRSRNEVPNFLNIKMPEINSDFFETEDRTRLEGKFQRVLDQASKSMLDIFIKEREDMREELYRHAEEADDEVQLEAMNRWILLHGVRAWNAWDHKYPVRSEIDGNIPLSTVVYQAAMTKSQRQVLAKIEAERMEKARKAQASRELQARQEEAEDAFSAMSRQEINQRIGDMIDSRVQAQVQAQVAQVQAQIQSRFGEGRASHPEESRQGNEDAPRETGAVGAAPKPKRNKNKKRNRDEEEYEEQCEQEGLEVRTHTPKRDEQKTNLRIISLGSGTPSFHFPLGRGGPSRTPAPGRGGRGYDNRYWRGMKQSRGRGARN